MLNADFDPDKERRIGHESEHDAGATCPDVFLAVCSRILHFLHKAAPGQLGHDLSRRGAVKPKLPRQIRSAHGAEGIKTLQRRYDVVLSDSAGRTGAGNVIVHTQHRESSRPKPTP